MTTAAERVERNERWPVSPQPVPVRARRLVGRDHEIAEIAENVSSVPLTTLTGPAGVGKTALGRLSIATCTPRYNKGPEAHRFRALQRLPIAILISETVRRGGLTPDAQRA